MLKLLLAAAALGVASATASYPSFAELAGKPYKVTYDKRALKIEGEHALFVSGAVLPPRGSPSMWRTWLAEAKANGLNMVQVCIFWTYHEPEEGVMDFGGVHANSNLSGGHLHRHGLRGFGTGLGVTDADQLLRVLDVYALKTLGSLIYLRLAQQPGTPQIG